MGDHPGKPPGDRPGEKIPVRLKKKVGWGPRSNREEMGVEDYTEARVQQICPEGLVSRLS